MPRISSCDSLLSRGGVFISHSDPNYQERANMWSIKKKKKKPLWYDSRISTAGVNSSVKTQLSVKDGAAWMISQDRFLYLFFLFFFFCFFSWVLLFRIDFWIDALWPSWGLLASCRSNPITQHMRWGGLPPRWKARGHTSAVACANLVSSATTAQISTSGVLNNIFFKFNLGSGDLDYTRWAVDIYVFTF